MVRIQKIALDAREALSFTPPALADKIEPPALPPTFLLRTCTRRDRERFEDMLIGEGVRRYSIDDIRAEMLRGLAQLWDEATFEAESARIKAFWADSDAFEKEVKELLAEDPKADLPKFDNPDAEHLAKLSNDITEAWPPIARMAAANNRFDETRNLALVAVALLRADNAGSALVREAGYATLDSVADIRDALRRNHQDVGRIAWIQLIEASIGRLFLLESAEKNSVSPPQSTPTPEPTPTPTPGDSATSNGTSPDSAISPKIPETSSTPNAGD